jgi:hypothetical protein
MHRRRHELLLALGLVLSAASVGQAANPSQPRIVVTVTFENEPILHSRILGELEARKIRLTPERHLADDAIGVLNDLLPIFAFVPGPDDTAVGDLDILVKPLQDPRQALSRPWPNGEVGMTLSLKPRPRGPRVPASPAPIKVLDAVIDSNIRITQTSFLGGRIAELFTKWPDELRAAIARIPIRIPAKLGPKGVQTEVTYEQVSPEFGSDQAVFRVELDQDGRIDRFRSCNTSRVAGPFVDSFTAGSCNDILSAGERTRPKAPRSRGDWAWPHIYLERFWKIPPN